MAQLLTAPFSYFTDSNGAPLAGGLIYTYAAGTTTPQSAYTDSSAGTPLSNPVVLDSAGRATIWLSGTYKIVVKDSLGNTISTTDNVVGSNASGDMTKAVYDAAGVNEQLVGLTATQTVSNKTFISPQINSVIPGAPQGRLTLVTGTPVMASDQTGKTSIFYTPYVGAMVPLYNGSVFVPYAFTEMTLTLNATNHPISQVYDVYVSVQSGTLTLSAMYWGSNTSRSTTAGGKSGTGNASIIQKNGLWVNNATISSSDTFNGATGYTIQQYQGTYLGTFYTTGNGQTGMAFNPSAASGGSNSILGLYNAYNRIRTKSRSADSTASWTYASATWRAANASNSNRVSFVDGLQQSAIDSNYACDQTSTTSAIPLIGSVLDSTTASPGFLLGTAENSNVHGTIVSHSYFAPQLGFHYVQAMESASNAVSVTFFANSLTQELRIEIDM